MTHEHDGECPGCGSSLTDREKFRDRSGGDVTSTDISDCPHCGSGKCCMCDMGDDVECVSCNSDDDGED